MEDPKQSALDQAYEIGAFIPGGETYEQMWQAAALAFRSVARCDLDIVYGAHPRARYDLFLPEGDPRGLLIYVHGGYWRMRHKSDWSHLSEGGLASGLAVAVIGYPLAPEVRVAEITSHVARAIAHAAGRIAGPIFLAGHSAGGHLAARMAMPGVLPDPVAARIERVVPISPVSDLRPLLRLSMNADLKLDAAEAEAESPVLGRPLPGITVTPLVGAEERPVFLDQNRWLAEAWDCNEIILPGRHHFDVIDGLQKTDSTLMRALLGQGRR